MTERQIRRDRIARLVPGEYNITGVVNNDSICYTGSSIPQVTLGNNNEPSILVPLGDDATTKVGNAPNDISITINEGLDQIKPSMVSVPLREDALVVIDLQMSLRNRGACRASFRYAISACPLYQRRT